MPIQRIVQKGEVFYRYGDSGKMYKDRKDAEKQAAAIHAAGYKEPMKDTQDKMSIASFVRKLYQALTACDSCGEDGGILRSGQLGGRTLCSSCVSAWSGN